MTNKELLKVSNLCVSFKSHHEVVDAVKGISFLLNKGETLALVGESGSGKSVTAMSILGLLPSSEAKGSVLFNGHELLNKGEAFLKSYRGKDIAMIFQEPMTSLNPLHSIEKQIVEPLLVHQQYTKNDTRSKVIELLKLVGFEDGQSRLDSFPHQLSGGQRQRVMIAMALACNPQLLIADEPTTALDVTIQTGIIALLKKLQSQFSMGLLLISHDLSMVSKLADRIAVMKNGKVVETGETSQILKNPHHPYTQHLIASEPSGHAIPLKKSSTSVISLENFSVTFSSSSSFFKKPSQFKAVNQINLQLYRGETLGIVGESGSGKSTLAYGLLKLLPSDGKIILNTQDITKLSVKAMRPLRSNLQIIFQDPFSSLNPRFSVADIVMEGLFIHEKHLKPQEKMAKVHKILLEVGLLKEIAERYPHELSGGQRQRIAIARALILHPKILVLDEPTSALDRSIQAEILQLLKGLQQKYQLTYAFISHDLKVVRSISHRILVMRHGKIIEEGKTEQIFQNPKSAYTQQLIAAAY